MRNESRMALIAALAWAIPAFALGTAAAQEPSKAPDKDGTLVLYDFEEGEGTDGLWTFGADMSVSDEHATSGEHSLNVIIHRDGLWGGFGPRMPRDWSMYEALKFDIWCEEDIELCIRIDDENSRDYATRFNLDGLKLRKGRNTVTIPVADLAARIDVTKIVYFYCFLGNKNLVGPGDWTTYLDNIRLVKEEPFDPPGPTGFMKTRELKWAKRDRDGALILYDFEQDEQLAGWQPRKAADVSISGVHPVTGKRSLKVVLKAGRTGSPQVDPVTPEDWTGCHALEFGVWSEGEMDLIVRITDPKSTSANRRFYDEKFRLRDGPNTVSVDLDAVAARIDLEHVRQLCIFRKNIPTDCVLYLDDLKLLE